MVQIAICALGNPLKRAIQTLEATHLLSLVNPGQTVFRHPRILPTQHLLRRCEDVLEGPFAPSEADAAAVITFARTLPDDARLVVHCHAGVSRSPAAAWIVLVARGASPEAALAEIRRIRPEARPNARLLRLGAEILGVDLPERAR
jgi:predicted protein tyrosine phosphatase